MDQSILKDRTILIVDDFEVNCELLAMLVDDTGAKPLKALNGLECIDIVKNQHIDMILMDSNMPVMDGIDTTRAIRELPYGKDIVIVGISLYEDDKEASCCLEAGMNIMCPKLALNADKLIELGTFFFTTGTPQPADEILNLDRHGTPAAVAAQPTLMADAPTMDYERALSEFENDEELVRSLMSEFRNIIKKQLSHMQEAFTRSDFNFIRKEAHGIKGGAANLCTIPLSDAAKSLEMACRQNSAPDTIGTLLSALAHEIHTFDMFVKTNVDIGQKA